MPDVAGLTDAVVSALTEDDKAVIEILKSQLTGLINIETILTQSRKLAQAIGSASVHGLDANGYDEMAQRICEEIGAYVNATLPQNPNPYSEIASWISGTRRLHSIEIFTPNYDLLIEEALERAHAPYFDGFSGSYRPFFDAASVSTDVLPPRWAPFALGVCPIFSPIESRWPAAFNFGPASVAGAAPTWAAHYVSSSSAPLSETPAWAA